MKNTILALAVVTLFALSGCSSKIAVIDMQEVYLNSQTGKTGVAYLTQLTEELQVTLTDAEVTASKARNKNTANLELREKIIDAQQKMNLARQHVMALMNQKVQTAVENYRKQKHIDVIIDKETVATYNEKINITKYIIEEIDKTPSNFSVQSIGTTPITK